MEQSITPRALVFSSLFLFLLFLTGWVVCYLFTGDSAAQVQQAVKHPPLDSPEVAFYSLRFSIPAAVLFVLCYPLSLRSIMAGDIHNPEWLPACPLPLKWCLGWGVMLLPVPFILLMIILWSNNIVRTLNVKLDKSQAVTHQVNVVDVIKDGKVFKVESWRRADAYEYLAASRDDAVFYKTHFSESAPMSSVVVTRQGYFGFEYLTGTVFGTPAVRAAALKQTRDANIAAARAIREEPISFAKLKELLRYPHNERELSTYLHGRPVGDITDEQGMTPLHIVDNARKALILIEAGANVNARDKNGNTPLINAVEGDDYPFVKLLLEQGADVDTANAAGWTALHKAARLAKKRKAKLLLAHGANAALRLPDGRTAYDLAQSDEMRAILQTNNSARE